MDREWRKAFRDRVVLVGKLDRDIHLLGMPCEGRPKQSRVLGIVAVNGRAVHSGQRAASMHIFYQSSGGYGKNKAACEELLLQAHADGKMPVTIMRPSHSYGEGGPVIRPVGPADTFIDRLRKGKPVIVQGDGNGLWASCHVDDVAKGFIATMGNKKCYGQAYNITADEYFSWNMYHEQVAEVAGGAYLPVYIPTDLLHERAPGLTGGTWEIFAWPSIFDNSKLKRDTDYPGQTIPFKEGVRRTLAWMEENGKIADSAKDVDEDALIDWWQKAVKT